MRKFTFRKIILTMIIFTMPLLSKAQIIDAGVDQNICTTTTTLAASAPGAGFYGLWYKISGAGVIVAPSVNNTTVNNIGFGANVFEWEVRNTPGDVVQGADQVTVTNNHITANAGPDASVCATTSAISANPPTPGTGLWSSLTAGVTFINPGQQVTTAENLISGTNTLRWTITNSGCVSEDEVVITNNQIPANAGADKTVCASTADITGNNPAPGTGTWTKLGGGATILTPGNAITTVENLDFGSNIFTWSIDNVGCTTSDNIMVINDAITADAGVDEVVCNTFHTMSAPTLPGGQTGTWSITQGNAIIDDVSFHATNLSKIGLGTNVFKWTVQNANCIGFDYVTLTNETPTISAGIDQAIYDQTSTTLTGNTSADSYSSIWSEISAGSSNIINFSSDATTVENLILGFNAFVWEITISGGVCTGNSYKDTVEVTVGVTMTSTADGTWDDPATWGGDIPDVYDKTEIEASVSVSATAGNCNEIVIKPGGSLTIGGAKSKGISSITTKGLTIEPDPVKGSKANRGNLTIGAGGSLTIEPDPAKKGFTSRIGGSLTIEPDPAKTYSNSFRIAAGSTVRVESGGSLTIEPDPVKGSKAEKLVTVDEGGNLIIEEGGILLNKTSVPQVAGTTIIEMTLEPDIWHFLSLPLNATSVNNLMGAFVLNYDESINDWSNLAEDDEMTALTGYIAKYLNIPQEVSFEGTLNGGLVQKNLQFSGAGFGYNLLGNPYAAPIYWNNDAGFNKTNTTGTIYIWDGSDYGTTNGTVGSPGTVLPVIAPNQAFFVQATFNGGLFEINENAQTEPTPPKEVEKITDIIRFKASNGDYTDEIAIYFDQNASINFDNSIDANRFPKDLDYPENNVFYPAVYSISPEGNKLTINALNLGNENTVSVPIGLGLNTSAKLNLTAFGFDGFDKSVYLYLQDKQNNTFTDLREQSEFSFNMTEGELNDRFVLHLSKSIPTGIDSKTEKTDIFSYEKSIYVNTNSAKAKVELYDLSGKKVMTKRLDAPGKHIISTNLETGNYFVKLIGDSKVNTVKVFVK